MSILTRVITVHLVANFQSNFYIPFAYRKSIGYTVYNLYGLYNFYHISYMAKVTWQPADGEAVIFEFRVGHGGILIFPLYTSEGFLSPQWNFHYGRSSKNCDSPQSCPADPENDCEYEYKYSGDDVIDECKSYCEGKVHGRPFFHPIITKNYVYLKIQLQMTNWDLLLLYCQLDVSSEHVIFLLLVKKLKSDRRIFHQRIFGVAHHRLYDR